MKLQIQPAVKNGAPAERDAAMIPGVCETVRKMYSRAISNWVILGIRTGSRPCLRDVAVPFPINEAVPSSKPLPRLLGSRQFLDRHGADEPSS